LRDPPPPPPPPGRGGGGGGGGGEKDPRGPSLNYSVYKFSENYEKIIPFFKKHKIVGIKSEDYL